jgi:hypothetical protein
LVKPPDNQKPPEIFEGVGPPPEAPPGFWGEVLYRYRDGKLVFVEVRKTLNL